MALPGARELASGRRGWRSLEPGDQWADASPGNIAGGQPAREQGEGSHDQETGEPRGRRRVAGDGRHSGHRAGEPSRSGRGTRSGRVRACQPDRRIQGSPLLRAIPELGQQPVPAARHRRGPEWRRRHRRHRGRDGRPADGRRPRDRRHGPGQRLHLCADRRHHRRGHTCCRDRRGRLQRRRQRDHRRPWWWWLYGADRRHLRRRCHDRRHGDGLRRRRRRRADRRDRLQRLHDAGRGVRPAERSRWPHGHRPCHVRRGRQLRPGRRRPRHGERHRRRHPRLRLLGRAGRDHPRRPDRVARSAPSRTPRDCHPGHPDRRARHVRRRLHVRPDRDVQRHGGRRGRGGDRHHHDLRRICHRDHRRQRRLRLHDAGHQEVHRRPARAVHAAGLPGDAASTSRSACRRRRPTTASRPTST